MFVALTSASSLSIHTCIWSVFRALCMISLLNSPLLSLRLLQCTGTSKAWGHQQNWDKTTISYLSPVVQQGCLVLWRDICPELKSNKKAGFCFSNSCEVLCGFSLLSIEGKQTVLKVNFLVRPISECLEVKGIPPDVPTHGLFSTWTLISYLLLC